MKKLAILYQSQPPPVKGGIQKPMKIGGYADSGADIAYALRCSGVEIVTPANHPSETHDLDWVFPDTREGIEAGLAKGAGVFWLNTVLYAGHPIEEYFDGELAIVGQHPRMVDRYDDKLITNKLLSDSGLFVPENQLIVMGGSIPTDLLFPSVLKPIRGRGSQGVSVVKNIAALEERINALFSEERYGNAAYVERFLPGMEITVTVLPGGVYELDGVRVVKDKHWCMPAVRRFNHDEGIAPYSGVVAVVKNSSVLESEMLATPVVISVYAECAKAAALIDAKAPIRIDCRADEDGHFYLFDVNLKPNMTGASRTHRKDQDSLSVLSARELGWRYEEFLANILRQQWQPAFFKS